MLKTILNYLNHHVLHTKDNKILKSIITSFTINFEQFHTLLLVMSVTFIVFFFGLFFVGNPYISVIIIFICFAYFCWNFFKLIQADLSTLNIIVFTSITSFIYYISGSFIFFILLAIKIIIFLLTLSFGLSFFYTKMARFTEISFMFLLLSIFSLGLFLGLVKLYFFNASIFFTVNHTPDYPILFPSPPSNIYLLLKNYDFLNVQNKALFILDFSSDATLNDFSIQLGQFKQTKNLFSYVFQLLCLDASWLPLHLVLVFT